MTDESPSAQDVRDIAKLELSTALGARNRLVEEHAASFRWLIASLFAANGGAIIALSAADAVPTHAKLWAGAWFTVGILCSLLIARMNQSMIQKTLDPLSNLIAFWGAVAHGMEFDGDEHTRLMDQARRSTKQSWPVQLCGWAAVLCFLFGMIAAGTGLWGASDRTRIGVTSKVTK